MNLVHATSTDDPRLEPFRAVGDPELIRRRGLFVAEGRRAVAALLADERYRVEKLLLSASAFAALEPALDELSTDVPVFVVDGPAGLQAVTGYRFHQGCLALAQRPAPRGFGELCIPEPGEAVILVGLEGVTNPDNVGTIFRSADAFGADAVVLSPGCAHPLYRKALRTSMGTTLGLPFAQPEPWPAAVSTIRERGITVLALTPAAAADDLDDVLSALPTPLRVMLLLGSEERGLEAATLALVDRKVRIPMAPGADSLNVAASAAIALHGAHARRTRAVP